MAFENISLDGERGNTCTESIAQAQECVGVCVCLFLSVCLSLETTSLSRLSLETTSLSLSVSLSKRFLETTSLSLSLSKTSMSLCRFHCGCFIFLVPSTQTSFAVAFHMYDLDDNGYITKDELEKILSSFYRLVGPLEDSPLATFTGKKYESPQQVCLSATALAA